MFVCVVCNADINFRPAEFVGEDAEDLFTMLEGCDSFWAAGSAESQNDAANFCVDAAYDKANGRENVGDCLYEPTGFMVEFDSITGILEGYNMIEVRVDSTRHNPLRVRWAEALA